MRRSLLSSLLLSASILIGASSVRPARADAPAAQRPTAPHAGTASDLLRQRAAIRAARAALGDAEAARSRALVRARAHFRAYLALLRASTPAATKRAFERLQQAERALLAATELGVRSQHEAEAIAAGHRALGRTGNTAMVAPGTRTAERVDAHRLEAIRRTIAHTRAQLESVRLALTATAVGGGEGLAMLPLVTHADDRAR